MLKTTRTQLRRFTTHDLELMQLLESDPEIMKYTPSRVGLSREQSREGLEQSVQQQAVFGNYGVWAAETHRKEFIGWFMLMLSRNEFPYPELGFMIVKSYWGQGFATEVARELLRYGFHDLKNEFIFACTDSKNLSSIRVLQKLGFSFVNESIRHDKVLQCDISQKNFLVAKFGEP